MTEDLFIGGAVVGGVVVVLKALMPILKKNGNGKSSGELDPTEWEHRIGAVVQSTLSHAVEGQNQILNRLVDGQEKINDGIVRLVAIQEQLIMRLGSKL